MKIPVFKIFEKNHKKEKIEFKEAKGVKIKKVVKKQLLKTSRKNNESHIDGGNFE